jgi:hypothetical protein
MTHAIASHSEPDIDSLAATGRDGFQKAQAVLAIRDGAELSMRGARRLVARSYGKNKTIKPAETLEAHWKRSRAEARTAFLDAIGVNAVLKHMTEAFARDLCGGVPARKNEQTNDSKGSTLSLTSPAR